MKFSHFIGNFLVAFLCLLPCQAGTVFNEISAADLPAGSGWEMRQFTSIEAAQGIVGDNDTSVDFVISNLVPNTLYSNVRVITYADITNSNHVANHGYDVTYTGATATEHHAARSLDAAGASISYTDVTVPQAGTSRHQSAVLPAVLSDATGKATFTVTPYSNPDTTETDLTKLRSYIDGVVFDDSSPNILSFASSLNRLLATESATLSWDVQDATTITITPDIGDVTSLTTNGIGSISVSPTDTVTYTLTATGTQGLATSTAGIRVIGENADKRPNIILFYIDDMGWQDTSVNFHTSETIYNRRYITPSMETLASNGLKFTNAYSASTICQTSRYALMSGLRPVTSGYTYNGAGSATSTIAPPVFAPAPIDTISTIPKSLKALGYETIHMGKWHIKGTNSNYSQNILASGYDRKIAANDAGQPGSFQGTSNYGSSGAANQVPDLEAYHGQNIFLTEAITLEANKAIEESMAKGKPFFLSLNHYAIHTPIQNDSRFTSHYNDVGDVDHYISNGTERSYATMIEGMDKSLGDIMSKLSALGIAEDTLIIFSSDHGGLTFGSRGTSAYPDGTFPPTGIAVSNQSHNYPLRYGKSWGYEGGIRVPMIISWGALPLVSGTNPIQNNYTVRSNETEDRLVNQIDLFPTLVKAAGGIPPETIHGYDVSHYISGDSGNDRPEKYVWHQPHYRSDHNIPHFTAMRYGKWKIMHRIESATWELYDLSTDIGENTNLASSEPRKMAFYSREMIRELEDSGARYATWVSNGQEIRPLPLVLSGADTDYDGVDDVDEDLNGNGIIDAGETDPSLFDHFSDIDFKSTPLTGSQTGISYVRESGASQDINFQLQTSTDLSDWIDVDLVGQVSDNGDSTETVTWSFDNTSLLDPQFYRLHITHLDLIQP